MKKFRSLFAIVLVIAMLLSLTVMSTSAKDITVTTFAELSEAIYEAKDGDVIKLSADITAENYGKGDEYAACVGELWVYNDITIDLNGYDITLSIGDIEGFVFGDNGYPVNVVITDTSSKPGTVNCVETNEQEESLTFFEVEGNSTLTIEKINVEQNFGNIVYCVEGNLIINSGNYTIKCYEASIIKSSMSPHDIKAPKCSVTINGGTFEVLEYIPQNFFDFFSINYILKAYNTDIEINGGTFKGFANKGFDLTGCNTTINYADFNTMGACIESCETTELDRYYPSSLIINDGIFKSTEYDAVIIESGDATINGGSFTAEYDDATALDINFGKVIINNGTFVSKYYHGIDLFCKGSLVINDCEASGCTAGLCIGDEYSHDLEDEDDEIDVFDLTLNGGKYTATLAYPSDYFDGIDDIAKAKACCDMTSGGIYIDYGYDLTDYLGEGYFYFSENGKNQFISSADDHVMKTENIVGISKDKSTIIDGKDQTIDSGKDNTISIKSDAAFRWFMDGNTQIGEVKVDGKTVDSKNFTAEAGSTKITFKADYLKTLSEGTHKVQIISNVIGNKVVAETSFTVTGAPTPTPEAKEETKAAEPEAVADTADTNMIGVFAALTALSAAGYVTVKKKED